MQLQEVADRDVVADAGVRSEYLEAWRRSGVTLANDYGHMFCSWRTEGFGGLVNDLMITLRSVARTTAVLDALRDHLIKFRRADDVVAAKRAGKHCIMWSTGGPPPWIEHDLGNLEIYHRLGFRQAQILYYTNRLGTQCYDRRDHGLTDAGVDYVRRLNGLGIVVDLAHCSRRTHLDAAAALLGTGDRQSYGLHRGPGTILATWTMRPSAPSPAPAASCRSSAAPAAASWPSRSAGWPTGFATSSTSPRWWASSTLAGADPMSPTAAPYPTTSGRTCSRRPPEPMDGQLDGSFAWVAAPYFTVALATRGYTDEEIAAIVGGNYLRVLREVCG